MASSALQQVRGQALELSEPERAELAHELLLSLDGQPDPSADYEWKLEIERRIAEIDAGTANLVDAEVVMQRVRFRLSGK